MKSQGVGLNNLQSQNLEEKVFVLLAHEKEFKHYSTHCIVNHHII